MRNPITDETRFVAQLLVTDTMVYEVVGRTPCTLKLRRTRDGERITKDMLVDGADVPECPPVLWTEQVPDEDAPVKVVRRRKDGTYRLFRTGYALHPCSEVDGRPVRRTDYRF